MRKIKTIAIQMNHVSSINIDTDATFAIGLEAQTRGYQLFHYTPDQLFMRNNKIYAHAEPMILRDIKDNHYELGEAEIIDLSKIDVVLIRQDPPFNMAYITCTYLLERLHPQTLVLNNPFWIRNSPEKLFVFEFSDLMPPTLISRNIDEIMKFRVEIGDIILKPLYGNGGHGVLYLSKEDRNFASLTELMLTISQEPFIVQAYLPQIHEGDTRILLLDGEPVGAINRVHAEHDNRSNIHAGGRAEPKEITSQEQEICRRIGASLRERGLFFTGIDVIGGYLTEINVTSPTCIREVQKFGGNDIASLFWNSVENKL
ncbi:Glutathione synthetase [Liberibacter crescens BT-1]|uniref:Glutathione synthetase n=1 Tax=Liberibacter crescens (strain BT-1) TaxID=1215343 RepID=L0ETL3_LIBCB|nr:glutathione synthase [Liberibacter crescens]AGA64170.1 Glutathione synthetase [Liberibacter crescens BT-1]AMC12434.1 glutathione synthetase [Liberibacter crescens]